jgi:hypothetical protein
MEVYPLQLKVGDDRLHYTSIDPMDASRYLILYFFIGGRVMFSLIHSSGRVS